MSEGSILIAVAFFMGALMGVTAVVTEWLRRQVIVDALPPQDWAGVRTRWARESDEAWYAAQRASAPSLRVQVWVCAVAAVACVGLAVARLLGYLTDDHMAGAAVTVCLAACLLMLLLCVKMQRDAKRAVENLALRGDPQQASE